MKKFSYWLVPVFFIHLNSIYACGGGPRPWEGTVSSAWNDSDNWSANCGGGVPGATEGATLSGSVTNLPVVSTEEAVGSIRFIDNGSLTISEGGDFTVNYSLYSTDNTQGKVYIKDGGVITVVGSLSSNGEVLYELSNGSTLNGAGQAEGAKAFINTLASGSGNTINMTSEGSIQKITSLNAGDQFNFSANVNVVEGMTLAGSLKLNSTLFGDLLLNGGSLSGTGILDGNLTMNGGTIAPGNSIGTFTIEGNFYPGSNSVYHVQVDSNGASSFLDVAGSAEISQDATVLVTSIDGGVAGNQYTILTAEEGISGTFGGVSAPGIAKKPLLLYSENSIFLLFQNFNYVGKTRNQKNVAHQLDLLTSPNLAETRLLDELNELDEAGDCKAFDALSGAQYVSFLSTFEIAANSFQTQIDDALRPFYTNNCLQPSCECQIYPWVEIGGSDTRFYKKNSLKGFQSNGANFSIGAHVPFGKWLVGSALGYRYDRLHFHDIGGSGKLNSLIGSVYSLYRGDQFYVLADIMAGYSTGSLSRGIEVGNLSYHARGKPKGLSSLGYIETGKNFAFCQWLVQPFIALEGGYYQFNKLYEKGAYPVNLKINRHSYGVANTVLGSHFTMNQLGGFDIGLDLAWKYRLTRVQDVLALSFQGFGNTFGVQNRAIEKNSLESVVYFTKHLNDNSRIFLSISADFWQKGTSGNLIGGYLTAW